MEDNWCHFLHSPIGTHPPLLVTVVVTRHGRGSHLAREQRITLVCVFVCGRILCFQIAMCWPAGAFPVLFVVLKHEGTFVLPMGATT